MDASKGEKVEGWSFVNRVDEPHEEPTRPRQAQLEPTKQQQQQAERRAAATQLKRRSSGAQHTGVHATNQQ